MIVCGCVNYYKQNQVVELIIIIQIYKLCVS